MRDGGFEKLLGGLSFGGIFGGIFCWCGGGLGMWGGNLGGRILGGFILGFLGMGFFGFLCIGFFWEGFFCGGFVGVDDMEIGGCGKLVIRGIGVMFGWFLGVCICIGGVLIIVIGLDDGRLGVFGVYLGCDVRRFFCNRNVEIGLV